LQEEGEEAKKQWEAEEIASADNLPLAIAEAVLCRRRQRM
jgi:hypothetical protein